jgi:hypothetical protein
MSPKVHVKVLTGIDAESRSHLFLFYSKESFMSRRAFKHHTKLAYKGKLKSSHDYYHAMLNSNPHQMAMMRNILEQKLGREPTHFHHKLPKDAFKDLNPRHIKRSGIMKHLDSPLALANWYQRRHQKDLKGGVSLSGIGNAIVKGVKYAGSKIVKGVKYGAKWAMEHPKEMKALVETAVAVVGNLTSGSKKDDEKIRPKLDDDDFTTDEEPTKKKGSGLQAGRLRGYSKKRRILKASKPKKTML